MTDSTAVELERKANSKPLLARYLPFSTRTSTASMTQTRTGWSLDRRRLARILAE